MHQSLINKYVLRASLFSGFIWKCVTGQSLALHTERYRNVKRSWFSNRRLSVECCLSQAQGKELVNNIFNTWYAKIWLNPKPKLINWPLYIVSFKQSSYLTHSPVFPDAPKHNSICIRLFISKAYISHISPHRRISSFLPFIWERYVAIV